MDSTITPSGLFADVLSPVATHFEPYCVMACMMRVLDVGPIDQLRANVCQTKAIGPREEPVRAVKNFANPELTNPSIVFVAHSKGKVEK